MDAPNAGLKIRAFAVTDDKFGPVTLEFTPKGIEEYLGTRSFCLMSKYVYTIPIAVCYRSTVSNDATETVYGDERIKGDILLFGGSAEGVRSLSDFEITTIRSCAKLMKFNGVCKLLISNVTKKPKEIPLEVGE